MRMPRPDATRSGTETDAEVTPATGRSAHCKRRTLLKAGTLGVGALAMGGAATASGAEMPAGDFGSGQDGQVDEPEGFSGETLATHGTFADDVSAAFTITYAEGDMGTVEIDQDDFASVVVARLTWEPEGTTGWHTHHAPVIANVESGELELTNELDCVGRTYTEGEAFVAQGQGNVHRATNPSESDRAVVLATYLGVPDGEPPTVWVEPPDC